MHLANQQNQQIYFFPQYHVNATMPVQFTHSHPSLHMVHRIQPQCRVKNQSDVRESKVNQAVIDNEQLTFRKDFSKNIVYQNQIPTSRQIHYQHQNGDISENNSNRTTQAIGSECTQRNKSLLQIKRKESIPNSNARQVREEYYKGQQNSYIEELMSKLPQLDLQPLSKNVTARQLNASPPVELKNRQVKKVSSPSIPFHLVSRNSLKQTTTTDNYSKIQQNDQNKQSRESSKYSSPIKNHQNIIKNLKQFQKTTQSPSPKKNQFSRCYTRKESSADTSHTASTIFQSAADKSSNGTSNFFKFLSTSNYQSKPIKTMSIQCQVSIEDKSKDETDQLKQVLKRVEKELEEQKVNNHQKELKIKKLQHEINILKINFEKQILVLQGQLNTKRQTQIAEVKESFEKQLNKFIADIKMKSSQQMKKTQAQLQIRFENEKNQLEMSKQNLAILKQELQYKLAQQSKKLTLYINAAKQNQIERAKLNQKINQFETKNQQLIDQCKKSQKPSAQEYQTQTQEAPVRLIINPQIQGLKQKNKMLEQKVTLLLLNLDKQNERLKQKKQQIDKNQRKIDQFSKILVQRDTNIKNMLKDIRGRDKHIADLLKHNTTLTRLINQSSQQKLKVQSRARNEKYRKIVEEDL